MITKLKVKRFVKVALNSSMLLEKQFHPIIYINDSAICITLETVVRRFFVLLLLFNQEWIIMARVPYFVFV